MGLKNAYDSTIKDLKATFFDLFCEHTSELVGVIETLASDSTADVMKLETLLFQRIIMLNKTAENVKSLMTSVDELNTVKGSGSKENSKNVTNAVTNSSKTPIEVVKTPATAPIAAPVTTPVVAPTTAPAVVSTTAPVAVPTTVPIAVPTTAPMQVPTTAPQQMPTTAPIAVPTTAPVVVPTTAPVAIKPPVAPVITPKTNPEQTKKSLTQMLTERANNISPRENKKYRFIKTSENKVKAILVTEKQYQKLKASYSGQAKILDFGIGTGIAPTKEKLEELMKKASSLYKEGKVSEAQALYAEISALNKQLKRTDSKVLTKVAA